jgi:hypothetical protein
MDKLDCESAEHEALCVVRREAYPRWQLGRFENLITMKMEAIYSSETTVPTRATRYNISKGIHQ